MPPLQPNDLYTLEGDLFGEGGAEPPLKRPGRGRGGRGGGPGASSALPRRGS
ncbi:MAG: hypothetical protein R3F43_01035 [bacterium]